MAAKAADGGGATDLIDIYDEKFSQNNGEVRRAERDYEKSCSCEKLKVNAEDSWSGN